MPTYEYECQDCSHTFERFQSITAKPLRRCPVCGGRLRRLIGAGAGVIFKGSGFYETDYKRKRSGPSSSASHADRPTGAGAKSDGAGKAKKPESGKDKPKPSKESEG